MTCHLAQFIIDTDDTSVAAIVAGRACKKTSRTGYGYCIVRGTRVYWRVRDFRNRLQFKTGRSIRFERE